MIDSDGAGVSLCDTCGRPDPYSAPPGFIPCRCGLWGWGARPNGEQWREIRHLLAIRAGHRCELCGGYLGPGNEGTAHHRDPRGAGGTRRADINDLCFLLLLCGGALGGVLGCHGYVEHDRTIAERHGWLLRDGYEPDEVPVVLYSGRRVRLARNVAEYLPPLQGPPYELNFTPRSVTPRRNAS